MVAAYACLEDESDSDFFFGFESREDLSRALNKQLDKIVPGRGLAAYALRHSMAQRMVDGGASRDEVAAALGHSSLHAVPIYFSRSAEQARLVNESLAISPTYQTMIKIGKDRFISDSELAELKGTQQIAGVPHGIPIAGIGGCQTGQPSCPYNPITSCYGCNKFMPVIDITIHQQVLTDFRGVVTQFRSAGTGDPNSPAFMQLQRTLSEVKMVIQQLENSDGE